MSLEELRVCLEGWCTRKHIVCGFERGALRGLPHLQSYVELEYSVTYFSQRRFGLFSVVSVVFLMMCGGPPLSVGCHTVVCVKGSYGLAPVMRRSTAKKLTHFLHQECAQLQLL